MEIEKKYLIKTLPIDLDSFPHEEISQAYVHTDPVIRVRRKGSRCILTVKSSGMMVREELELPITKEQFSGLLKKAEGLIIEKTRYRIPAGDSHTIELDIFHGNLEGFIMAEVEFEDVESAGSFLPPAWFGREVTNDYHFHNSWLSGLDPEGIRAFLDRLATDQHS